MEIVAEKTASAEIGQYVEDMTFDRIPLAAVANAKAAILDALGVALAARWTDVGTIVVDHSRTTGSGPCQVVGSSVRTTAEAAAFANGVLAHALDFDDRGHASTHVLPAALATGETAGATGRRLIEAYAVGREVRMHLADYYERCLPADGRGPMARGWHSTGVFGGIGAAAAAAKVMGLSAEHVCMAVGIAVSLGGGVISNFGTMTKPVHAGNAARNGVLSASLAEAGMTSNTNVFGAARGFESAIGLPDDGHTEEAVRDLRADFHLASHGVQIKPYPSCSATHPYIESARALRARHPLAVDDIASIRIPRTPLLAYDYPSTWLEAKFSAAFCVVLTLLDGTVSLENCVESSLSRDAVSTLLSRTSYGPADDLVLRVDATDGRRLAAPVEPIRSIGTLKNLDSDAARWDKFMSCAAPVVGEAAAVRIGACVRELETLDSVRELTRLLASDASARGEGS